MIISCPKMKNIKKNMGLKKYKKTQGRVKNDLCNYCLLYFLSIFTKLLLIQFCQFLLQKYSVHVLFCLKLTLKLFTKLKNQMSARTVNPTEQKQYFRNDARSLDYKHINPSESKLHFLANRIDMRIQLKCEAQCREYEQGLMYSFNNHKNNTHNHRKIKTHTIYEYQKNDMPRFNENYRQSVFSPFFLSEHDKKFKLKFITHEEKKQKEQQQYYQKQLGSFNKKRKQLKKNRNERNNHQGMIVSEDRSEVQPGSNKKHEKVIKTRQQIKQEELGSYLCTISRQPFPDPKNNYCFPCRSTYVDYERHITEQTHKNNIKQCLGEEFLDTELEKLAYEKLHEIKSNEFKCLNDFADFLQKVVDQLEQYCQKRNLMTKEKLRNQGFKL